MDAAAASKSPPTVKIDLTEDGEDEPKAKPAKAIPVLHLALNLGDGAAVAAAPPLKDPTKFEGVNTRTIALSQFKVAIDNYFVRVGGTIHGSIRGKEFYKYFWKCPREYEAKFSEQERLQEIIFYLFPATKNGATFPPADLILDKIYSSTKGVTTAEVQAVLLALTPIDGPSRLKLPSGRTFDPNRLTTRLSDEKAEDFFTRVVKANQEAFDQFEVLVIGKGTMRTLPKGLRLLPNLRGIHFLGGEVLSLPHWIGDLPLTSLKILNTDAHFRIDRFLQNLQSLQVFKVWAYLSGSLSPITELKTLLNLELPSLNDEIATPFELEGFPELLHSAFTYDSAQKPF